MGRFDPTKKHRHFFASAMTMLHSTETDEASYLYLDERRLSVTLRL